MRLEIQNLSFSYGEKDVLHDISFSVGEGEFYSLLGPNGVGKTTLFQCILGNLKGYGGRILVDGEEINRLGVRERAKKMAYIPQIHRQTFGYTVLDITVMGIARQMSLFSRPGREELDVAMASLEQMGVADLKDRNYQHLSGGEQQLVLIARALTQQAEILIMDEPTSSLDFGNQHRVLEKVRQLTDQNYSVLLSTHNPQHALSFADKVLAVAGGRVAACGKPQDVMTGDLMQKLYRIPVKFIETEAGQVLLPCVGEETEEPFGAVR